MGGHPALDAGGRPRHRRPGRRPAQRGRVAPRRTPRGGRRPPTGTSPTGCSRSRSARCASAASRRTTTAPRWSWSTSRPSSSSRSPRWSTRSTTPASSSPTAAASRPTTRTYAKLVEAIIRDEIGQGEGANLVIGRHYRAMVADWGADKALTVFRRLLERERGAYWTYVFFTGDRYLIGASPERHVSVHGGDVRMNPISGTFRIPPATRRRRPEGQAPRLPRRREGDLRALHGRRRGAQDDVRHLPRGRPGARPVPQADDATSCTPSTSSPAAPPATSARCCATRCTPPRSPASPVENACRLIKQYETEGRGYYGAALALLGRDADGRAGRRTARS